MDCLQHHQAAEDVVRSDEFSKTAAKLDLHPQKIMLNIWWDYKGVLFLKLLPQGQTIDSKKYYVQLDKLRKAVQEKWPELSNRKGVVFHHNND